MFKLYKLITYLETLSYYKNDDEIKGLLDSLYQELAKLRFKQVLNRQVLLKENKDKIRELSYMKSGKLDKMFLNEGETFLNKYGMSEGQFKRMMKDLSDIEVGVLKTELLYYKSNNPLALKALNDAKDGLNNAYDNFILFLSDNEKINNYVYRYLDMYYFFKDRIKDKKSKIDYTMFERFINNEDKTVIEKATKYLRENKDILKRNAKVIQFKRWKIKSYII